MPEAEKIVSESLYTQDWREKHSKTSNFYLRRFIQLSKNGNELAIEVGLVRIHKLLPELQAARRIYLQKQGKFIESMLSSAPAFIQAKQGQQVTLHDVSSIIADL